MKTNLFLQISRCRRSAFTLVELLVVIAIIAILAGVALGPITSGLRQAKHNAAMQQAHTLGQLSFNYSTDNTTGGNKYPGGGSAATLATLLVTSGYATDASIFYVAGQKNFTAATSTTVAASNVSWCYTVDTDGSTGLSSCGDTIPIVFFDQSAGVSPITAYSSTANQAVDGTVTSDSPQATDGIAVYYRGNNASYIKAAPGGVCAGVVPASNTDTTVYGIAP